MFYLVIGLLPLLIIYFLGRGFLCLKVVSFCTWDESLKMAHEDVIPARELITSSITNNLIILFIWRQPLNSTDQTHY